MNTLCRSCASCNVFGVISLQRLGYCFRAATVARGRILQRHGEAATHVWLLVAGDVRLRNSNLPPNHAPFAALRTCVASMHRGVVS